MKSCACLGRRKKQVVKANTTNCMILVSPPASTRSPNGQRPEHQRGSERRFAHGNRLQARGHVALAPRKDGAPSAPQ